MLTRRYQLLLLAAVVLAAFYPAVLADFSTIDDAGMVEGYRSLRGWELGSFFIPFAGKSLYYRPLLGLSFLIDKHFFGLLPGLMHLENVLFHLLNAVLVYFLTLYLLPSVDRKVSLFPLLAALLFGLHPVNTESVNWISGRTDVLAGTFILSSALCIMKFRELHEKKYAVLSIITFLGGALVKETAIAFLPGAFLLIHAVPRYETKDASLGESGQDSLRFNSTAKVTLGVLLAVLIFYLPRFTSIKSHTGRIWFALIATTTDWMHSMFVMLRAFGFYIKKLVFPYPLNFAIMEVDPLYEVLAVLLVAICLYVLTRRTILSAVFVAGVCLITPSFLLAFGQIAWTPYAERYVYIASAFLVTSLVVYLHGRLTIPHYVPMRAVVLILLSIMFVSTLSRGIIWQNDMKLAEDTVKKSPMARDIKLVYSTLLTEKGDYAEALNQLEQGRNIPFFGYDERFDLNTANIYYKQGRINDAIRMSEAALQRSNGESKRALGYLIDLMENKKESCKNRRERRKFDNKIFGYRLALFKLDRDPRVLYELGITAEMLGERKKALSIYRQACNNMMDDEPYKKLALRKIKALSDDGSRDYAKDF